MSEGLVDGVDGHRGSGTEDLWGGGNPRQGRGGMELGMMKVAVGRLVATASFLVH